MRSFQFRLLLLVPLAFGAGLAALAQPQPPVPVGAETPPPGTALYLPGVVQGGGPYALQPGTPVYLTNFLNNHGCAWHGVAGRAFDAGGQPVLGLLVRLTGGGLDATSVTGYGPEIGPGGYVLVLGDAPVDSDGLYRLQLLDAGCAPLSAQYALRTYADCARNLILVNFTEVE